MKKANERKIVSLEIPIEQVIECLRIAGMLHDDYIRPDMRVLAIESDHHQFPQLLHIHLESDHFDEEFLYRGYFMYAHPKESILAYLKECATTAKRKDTP